MPPEDTSTALPPSRPRLPPVGTALKLLSQAAGHRTELATLELDEARDHAITTAVWAGASIALTLLAGFAITLLAAALVWDSPHRIAWLIGLSVLYVVAATTTVTLCVARLRIWRPFAETQNQLNQDFQCLRNLIDQAVR